MLPRCRKSLFLAGLCYIAMVAGDVAATTWLVSPDQSGDAPTIQAAVDAAAPGDTISLTDGTFTGAGNKDVQIYGKAIVIRSVSDNPSVCIIDCEAQAPAFYHAFVIDSVGGPGVPGDAPVVLEGITITRADGHFGGAVVCRRSRVEIVDCVFDDNFATYGGGIYAEDSSAVTLTRCVFSNNDAVGDGAISFYGVELSAIDCLFVENGGLADGPGAFWGRDGTASFDGCAFVNNWAKYGGAVQMIAGLTTAISNCTFVGNRSQLSDGSAISSQSSAVTTIDRSIFAYNGPGAAISGCGESLSVACTDFYGNSDGGWTQWTDCLDSALTTNGNFALNPIFCDTLGGDYALASFSPCLPANNACGVLVGAYDQGCTVPSAIDQERPARFPDTALQVAPNPFNPRTTISYTLPVDAVTTIHIYDVAGRRVRSLIDGFQPAGPHEVVWDGRGDGGENAASGSYFIRLVSGGIVTSVRVVLLK